MILGFVIHSYQSAIAYHKIRGEDLPQDPEEAMEVLEETMAHLLDTKDEQGKKKVPGDQHIAFLVEAENKERKQLESVCRKSLFYQHLFGNVEGVGPALGARFITAIERIERFNRPEDLSNYAGMLPRGKECHLPSRFKSKGKTLSRSPNLNTTCFLLQDYMFQWGRKSDLGQVMARQIQQECPCTQAERDVARELCKLYKQAEKQEMTPPCSQQEYEAAQKLPRRYSDAVKRARIAMTRHFLEKILHPKWKEYMGSAS